MTEKYGFELVTKAKKTPKGFSFSIGQQWFFLNAENLNVSKMLSKAERAEKNIQVISGIVPSKKACEQCGAPMKNPNYKFCYRCWKDRQNG
jgi:hypothetical protein